MAKTEVQPLFYRPPPRWYFWTALGAALAIHLTAVAVSQRHEAPAVDLPPQPPQVVEAVLAPPEATPPPEDIPIPEPPPPDRKSTRLNSSHVKIPYAVFCLKKKKYNISIIRLSSC